MNAAVKDLYAVHAERAGQNISENDLEAAPQRRALIITDSHAYNAEGPLNNLSLRQQLAGNGFQSYVVHCTEHYEDLLERNHLDAVVLDIAGNLNGHGAALALNIARYHPNLLVIRLANPKDEAILRPQLPDHVCIDIVTRKAGVSASLDAMTARSVKAFNENLDRAVQAVSPDPAIA